MHALQPRVGAAASCAALHCAALTPLPPPEHACAHGAARGSRARLHHGGERVRRRQRCSAAARRSQTIASARTPDAPRGDWGPFKAGDLVSASPDASVRYRVQSVLGAGSSSHVYEAVVERTDAAPEDAAGPPSGELVALKAVRVPSSTVLRATLTQLPTAAQLSLRGAAKWKGVDLIEREARTLRGLKHPGVPALVEAFELDTASDRVYVLAQRLSPGSSLQALVDGGAWRPDEEEIETIAARLLDIVAYLHARRPPIIHRDIKPQNIVYEPVNGAVALVDFGAVRESLADGSTMIGTYGYMPAEQFLGKATAASDMYTVGATLLFLLTRKPPGDLPQRGLGVDWERAVEVGPRLRALLSGTLLPEPEERLTATQAQAVLRGEAVATTSALARPSMTAERARTGPRRRPKGAAVEITRDGFTSLTVVIPPAGLGFESVAQGGFATAWLGFVGFWTAGVILGGAPIMAIASVPFWAVGAQLARDTVDTAAVSTELTVTREEWRLSSRLKRAKLRSLEGATSDLDGVLISTAAEVNGVPVRCLQLQEGVRQHRWGLGLQQAELEWIADEVNAFLADVGAGRALLPDE